MSRRITIEFLGKDKSLGRTAAQVDGKVAKVGDRLKSFGKAAALGLAAGAAVGGKALFDMGQKAGDLNETVSKTNAIFGGPAAKNLEKWAKGAATSLGQSQQTALDAASVFGTFGKAAGKSGMDLAKFAKQNTELATDLASFHNASPEEAIEALGAAFRGEAEPMRKFGVLLDDASMREEALRQGLIKTTKEALTPQQKVLAAQGLIMKQTKDAQGDFARTSGGLANQQRILRAQFENVQVAIGQKVLPVLLKIATFVNERVLPALKTFGGWLNRTLPPIFEKVRAVINRVLGGMRGDVGGNLKSIQQIFKSVTSIIRSLWDRFGKHIIAIGKAVFRALRPIVSGGLKVIAGIFKVIASALKGDWKGAWEGIKSILRGAWTVIKAVVKAGASILKAIMQALGGVLRDVMRAAWEGVKAAVSRGVAAAVGLMRSLPGRALNALGNLGRLLWNAGSALIQGLIDGVQSKVSALTSKLSGITKLIPKFKGPMEKDRRLLTPAGVAIMEGLIKGIQSRRTSLTKVLSELTRFIEGSGKKLAKRAEMVTTFKGMASGVFSADLSDPETGAGPDIQSVLQFQQQQMMKAQQLAANMKAVAGMGLSKSLIKQFAGSGESGAAALAALAGGNKAQIKHLNKMDAATTSSLAAAGVTAGNSVYGISGADRRDRQTAIAVREELQKLLKQQDKNTHIVLELDGRVVHTSLLKRKRTTGKSLGLA